MKKYIWHWSILNLGESTQKPIEQLRLGWAAFAAMIMGGSFLASDSVGALIASVICFVVDKAISCIYLEEKK